MAITFLQQKKRQKRFILIFTGVILITLVVIWQGFFTKKEEALPIKILMPPKIIQINLKALEDPKLQELQSFLEVTPLQEAIGRANPFIPY